MPGTVVADRDATESVSGVAAAVWREFDVNTGPWELRLMDASTAKKTLDAHNRPPE
jgi:hypothetical protein